MWVHRRTALREGVNSCKRWLAGVDGIILGLSPAKAGSPELATTFLFSSPGTAPSPEQGTQLSRCTKSAKKPKQRFPVASVFPTNINRWLCRLTRNGPLRLRLVTFLQSPHDQALSTAHVAACKDFFHVCFVVGLCRLDIAAQIAFQS